RSESCGSSNADVRRRLRALEAEGPSVALGDMVGDPRARALCLLRVVSARVARHPRTPLARARSLALNGSKQTKGRRHQRPSFRRLSQSGKIRVPMARYIYNFVEPSEGGGKDLLGGKGAGLAEMTQLGVPVPAGFTITTDACRDYMAAGKRLPAGLEDEISDNIRALEQKTGKRFGDNADPLLVSVRSGAAVSMPGMMD